LELKDFKEEEGAAAMRSTAIQYVGIDVHQATLVCAVKDENGRTIIESKVATEREAIMAFLRGLGGRLRVAFEEGTQAQWLHDLVRPLAEEVIVCDPRRIVTKGNKADRIDAERIAELLRLGALVAVFHRGSTTRTLKEMVRLYEGLVDDTTRVMLRIRAMYRGRAIGSSSRSVYHPAKRAQWLEQITEEGARYRAAELYKQLDALTRLRQNAKRVMITEARRHKAYELLRSIPGIGPIRAAEIVAIVGDPRRFRTKRQLWPYAGLAVVTRTSGEWRTDLTGQIVRSKKRPLTRGLNQNFNRGLKKIFKGAARDVTAKRCELQRWYGAMVDRGMRPELARLTLARKIAAMVLAIWKKGAPYDPKRLKMQPV
jgi:transposase